jgi:hypothetical protein
MQIEARDDGTMSWIPQTVSYALTMNSDGSLTIRFWADLPNIDSMGWNTWAQYRIRIERLAVTDHALLDTADATTGWFARNEWFRVAYYAVAQGYTTATLPTTCTTGTNCLFVANVTPAGAQRAILILAGRSLNGNARPSAALADYLEFGNRTANFEKLPVTGASSSAYMDTGSANAYNIAAPVTIGRPVQFKAVNANTGASTLSATGIGAANLVNADGSSLAASQIQAGAVSEIAYDGTQFKLYKRPYNDRIIVIDSN